MIKGRSFQSILRPQKNQCLYPMPVYLIWTHLFEIEKHSQCILGLCICLFHSHQTLVIYCQVWNENINIHLLCTAQGGWMEHRKTRWNLMSANTFQCSVHGLHIWRPRDNFFSRIANCEMSPVCFCWSHSSQPCFHWWHPNISDRCYAEVGSPASHHWHQEELAGIIKMR